MGLKYILREVIINKKFARTQQVSWQDRKKLIYDMMREIGTHNLFLKTQEQDPAYNLYTFPGGESSLAAWFDLQNPPTIVKPELLSENEQEIDPAPLTLQNYGARSFMFTFNLTSITHSDMLLFRDGNEETLFEYLQGDNAGSVFKTIFGIVVSERLQKIFIIKQSDQSSLSLPSLLLYLNKKSQSFVANLAANSFKPLTIPEESSFDPENVANVQDVELGINSDLIADYRARAGEIDPFAEVFILPLLGRVFGTGRVVKLSIRFSEDGDRDAMRLFNDIYGSFEQIQDEELGKLFTNFKLLYEDQEGVSVTENFKRTKTFSFTPDDDVPDVTHILAAFRWIAERIAPAEDA